MKIPRSSVPLIAAVVAAFHLTGCSPANDLGNDAAAGDLSAVKADLAKTPVDSTAWPSSGQTALGDAAANGQLAVVQFLLSAGANVEAHDKDLGWTPLMLAAGNHDKGGDYPGVVSALLAAGANPNAKGMNGDSALGQAASLGGDPKVVPLLVSAGADVNDRDGMGFPPLSWASWHGDLPMMQALIDAGADVNPRSTTGISVQTPLDSATSKGQLAAVQLLIKAGANVINEVGPFGTPLGTAAQFGYISVVQALLDAGAGIRTPSGASGRKHRRRAPKIVITTTSPHY